MVHWARYVFGVIGLALGFSFGQNLLGLIRVWFQWTVPYAESGWILIGTLVGSSLAGLILGYWLGPRLVKSGLDLVQWAETKMGRVPGQDIVFGSVGTIIGLIIAFLLGPALQHISNYLPAVVSLFLGYLGWVLAVKKREDLQSSLFGIGKRLRTERERERTKDSSVKILDTSAIIDGRIADLSKTGFLEGELVIASFVLDELRHIADSSDVLKRNRGRRGLDILNMIQREKQIKVRILDRPLPPQMEVDAALVQLAKELGGKVITNDFNLNKVAEFQGVKVLNINELSNAVKPAVLPGEEMNVQVIRDGREAGQGVAYLDDGTMIVVDGGKNYIGETVEVEVTSVLQTSAGRMIFAKLKQEQPSVVSQ